MEFDQVGITPEQKDYCFYPSQLKPLEFLSESQVLQYNKLGFTDPQNGFEESEILAQRNYFDSLLSQLKANPQKAERGFNAIQYSLNCAHIRLRGLWEIMYSENFFSKKNPVQFKLLPRETKFIFGSKVFPTLIFAVGEKFLFEKFFNKFG